MTISEVHPFITTLHSCFHHRGKLYFIMDFCSGGDFYRFLQAQPGHRLPEAAAKFYAAEVLLALEYLHFIGVIYRDLKPENILIHETGGPSRHHHFFLWGIAGGRPLVLSTAAR